MQDDLKQIENKQGFVVAEREIIFRKGSFRRRKKVKK
jgi:hypothetical protein